MSSISVDSPAAIGSSFFYALATVGISGVGIASTAYFVGVTSLPIILASGAIFAVPMVLLGIMVFLIAGCCSQDLAKDSCTCYLLQTSLLICTVLFIAFTCSLYGFLTAPVLVAFLTTYGLISFLLVSAAMTNYLFPPTKVRFSMVDVFHAIPRRSSSVDM